MNGQDIYDFFALDEIIKLKKQKGAKIEYNIRHGRCIITILEYFGARQKNYYVDYEVYDLLRSIHINCDAP